MSCHDYGAALVDLARGAAVDEGMLASVRAHLAQCAACAARLETERALTADLAVFAQTTVVARPSEALEARLLQAFNLHRLHHVHHVHHVRPVGTGSGHGYGWRSWLAGAAGAAIVVTGIAVGWRAFPVGSGFSRTDFRLKAEATKVEKAEATKVETPAPGSEDPGLQTLAVGPGLQTRPTPVGHRRSVVEPAGFVALPGAAWLPEFESGTIQRVALALSSLPVYGVEIAPDAAAGPIEADLLVGQDGQPRAIRLVTINSESTSRPERRSKQ